MAERPRTINHQPFAQGSESHSLSPTNDSSIGYFSPPKTEHKIPYHHLHSVYPITRQFLKAVRLIPGIHHVPYASRKPKATPTGVVVSLVEEVVLATLEGMAKAIEDEEETSVFQQGELDILVILGSDSDPGGVLAPLLVAVALSVVFYCNTCKRMSR